MYEKIIDFDKSYELLKELRDITGGQLGANVRRYWATDENYLDGRSNYLVTIGDTFSLNKLIKFTRNSKRVITEILSTEDIMYAKNPYSLKRWGNELKFSHGRKRNEPDEIFDSILIWEVVEISEENKEAVVKLPNRDKVYKISLYDIQFMDRKPNELEFRNQEMLFKWRQELNIAGRSKSNYYPVLSFRGSNAEKILKTPSGSFLKINIWDEVAQELRGYHLTVDEALIAMNSCIWDNWESGSEPKQDVLHSDFNNNFLNESQTKSSENLLEFYYNYVVFMDKIRAAFTAVENFKEYQNLLCSHFTYYCSTCNLRFSIDRNFEDQTIIKCPCCLTDDHVEDLN